ncbi:MAG: 50S ribosomal protein L23 [Gammaproteobacteria bacterium]
MNQERLMKLLLAPVISEKSTRVADAHRQFVFKVDKSASKPEVRKAVELMFDVKVNDVRISNMRGKIKRHGQTAGKRADWKKAYVTLAEGHDIDFMGAE